MEKPSEQMLVENVETMNHMLGQETNYRNTIYGIFYRLSYCTIVLNGGESTTSKKPTGCWPKLKQCLPLLVGIPILLRTIVLITQLSKSTLLTKTWAVQLSFVVLSAHGFIATLILFSWNATNFLNEFSHKLHLYLKTRDKQVDAKQYRCTHILAVLFFIFYLYAFGYFCVENFFFHSEHHNLVNSTAFYRESLTGTIALWPVDALIIVWTAFISAILLIFYYLINHALIVETTQFNKELREAGESGQLQHADLLNNYANRHLELVSIIKFANEKLSAVATPNLMAFAVCHFMHMFVMRGFETELLGHQKILSINLLLASLFALLINIKHPAGLNTQIHETKKILFFEKSIWKEAELKLNTVANTIIDRILKGDFYAVIFDGFVICERLFHVIFFIGPMLIEVLACWKRFMN